MNSLVHFIFLGDLGNYLVISSFLSLKVAHLPDKANNYLTPALSALEKNT